MNGCSRKPCILIVVGFPRQESHDHHFSCICRIRNDHPEVIITTVKEEKCVARLHALDAELMSFWTASSFFPFFRSSALCDAKFVAASKSSSGINLRDPLGG